ncbi:MAG: hypothetical protein HKN47_18785 [Pirellulaceae bacterium]|nr:hypothetical protein [Pirellulaceae bacterium]
MGIALGFSVLMKSVGLLVVAVLPIRVTTTDGQSVEGDFVGVQPSTLLVETATGKQEFSFENLQSIVPVDKDDDATGPTIRVTLVGGSQIAVQDLRLKNDQLTIEPRRQKAITIPVKEVRSIRFRAASPATDPQWLGLVAQESRGDVLAIRRANDQLDPAPGVVEGIGPDNVQFVLDGDSIQAPIERIEGVVFGGVAKADVASKIQVVDQYGSRWAVTRLLPCPKGGPLHLELSENVTHQIPLSQLHNIFFSGGFTLLASIAPANSTYQPYIESKVNETLRSAWFGPKASGDDVLLSGGGSVEYRIDDAYTTLAGSARRDSSVAKAGAMTLSVLVDDKEVWQASFTDAEPRGFELSVKDSRRVRFVADSGDDGDLGDMIRVTRPRLLK